jgi:hypothetical protein
MGPSHFRLVFEGVVRTCGRAAAFRRAATCRALPVSTCGSTGPGSRSCSRSPACRPIVELPSGATHGIGPALTVGDKLGDTSGNGRIAADAKGFTWTGTRYARVRLWQKEVRVGVDAATLTLPPGAGPFPAAAMVDGSGAQTRSGFRSSRPASSSGSPCSRTASGVGQSSGSSSDLATG